MNWIDFDSENDVQKKTQRNKQMREWRKNETREMKRRKNDNNTQIVWLDSINSIISAIIVRKHACKTVKAENIEKYKSSNFQLIAHQIYE